MQHVRIVHGKGFVLGNYDDQHFSFNSQAAFAETGEGRDFGVAKEVTILGVSLYVVGIGTPNSSVIEIDILTSTHPGIGPLLVGPLSEVYGRSIIYRVSYSLFWIFSWPVAFAPNIGTPIHIYLMILPLNSFV